MIQNDKNKHRRKTDGLLAALGRFWDWIDERDIDKHAVSLVILLGTVEVVRWAMGYANLHADKSGADIGLTIAAVTAPYMALQAAALSFYFKART